MSGKRTTNADEPRKLDLRSHEIVEERQQELLRLFPEIRTEGGKVDLERPKLAPGEAVDVGKKRFGLTWPGKADSFRTLQAPGLPTMRPCPAASVEFDTTENLVIEGDNLEVLKLLPKSYLGKSRCSSRSIRRVRSTRSGWRGLSGPGRPRGGRPDLVLDRFARRLRPFALSVTARLTTARSRPTARLRRGHRARRDGCAPSVTEAERFSGSSRRDTK